MRHKLIILMLSLSIVLTGCSIKKTTNLVDAKIPINKIEDRMNNLKKQEYQHILSKEIELKTVDMPVLKNNVIEKPEGKTESSLFINNNSYESDNLKIKINNTSIRGIPSYIVNVWTNNPTNQFRKYFANGNFSSGFQTLSSMSKQKNAILSINASCLGGGRALGLQIKDGIIYNDYLAQIPMIMNKEGLLYSPSKPTKAQDLLSQGAYNTYSFGPVLVRDGKNITLEKGNLDSHIGVTKGNSVRTIMAQKKNNEYIIIITRVGVPCNIIADELVKMGIKYAYNLDGGGSTEIYFNGKVLFKGTSPERPLGDMIYFTD